MNTTFGSRPIDRNWRTAGAFALGYYGGQIILWVAGIKGIPKVSVFQLLNATVMVLIGYGCIRWFFSRPKAEAFAGMVVVAVTVARYFVVVLVDRSQNPSVSPIMVLRNNMIELFTFGVMLATAFGAAFWYWRRSE